MRLSIRNIFMVSASAVALSFSAAAAQTLETEIISLPVWHAEFSTENAISVDDILEMDVYGPTGDEIGEVENVLLDTEGRVLSVIAEVGGFWDIGDTHVNVPWDEVDVDPVAERVSLPVTQETVENYTLFTDELIAAADAATEIQEVGGDGPGVVETAPRVWRATELIDDYVRLRGEGEAFVNYGYVDDLLIEDGEVSAVVVRPDTTFTRGLYAYPYYGYGYGWTPGAAYYDLPYSEADIEDLEPLGEGFSDS